MYSKHSLETFSCLLFSFLFKTIVIVLFIGVKLDTSFMITHLNEPTVIVRWISWKLKFLCTISIVRSGIDNIHKRNSGDSLIEYDGSMIPSSLHSELSLYNRFQWCWKGTLPNLLSRYSISVKILDFSCTSFISKFTWFLHWNFIWVFGRFTTARRSHI